MPKPCHLRHPESAPGCRLCDLAERSAHYQARWGLPVTADPDDDPGEPKARPCPHFAAFTPDERAARGLRPDRRTGLCALGYGTADRVVCVCWASPSGCKGCPRTPPGQAL